MGLLPDGATALNLNSWAFPLPLCLKLSHHPVTTYYLQVLHLMAKTPGQCRCNEMKGSQIHFLNCSCMMALIILQHTVCPLQLS